MTDAHPQRHVPLTVLAAALTFGTGAVHLPALPLATLSVVIATAAYHHTQQTETARSRP